MMIVQGQTAHFIVSYDSNLTGQGGQQPTGQQLAQTVLDYCEYDFARLSLLFGNIMPQADNLPFNINIIASSPGMSSNTNDGNIAIPAGVPPTITLVVAPQDSFPYAPGLSPVTVAEEAEIFMVIEGGWNPGWSDGEALSRTIPQFFYPQTAELSAEGSSWFNPSTFTNPADWVENVEQTDTDDISYGCGCLFLNYLAYQLNYTWPAIVAAGNPTSTLAGRANILGVPGAYAPFLSLLQSNFPTGNLHPPATPFNELIDDVFPLGPLPAQLPSLYMRHNTADNGTSHSPPLSTSPDIIVKNNQVANPQTTYSTAQSIGSSTESDPSVLKGQTNYVYLRVWNRGANAENVFATVYWSPPATLVTPQMWTLVGGSYYPEVPAGSTVEVSAVGIPWTSSQIPAAGHYCFVATVGNNYKSAPDPQSLASFATFQDYVNYILANNNVTWRNFNVVEVPMGQIKNRFGGLIALPFLITGAWDAEHAFALETIADLPKGSVFHLQAAEWIGRGLTPALGRLETFEDFETDAANPRRLRIPLPESETRALGEIRLPATTAAASHLLVHIPPDLHRKPHDVAIRQLYKGQEVGRITWRLVPHR